MVKATNLNESAFYWNIDSYSTELLKRFGQRVGAHAGFVKLFHSARPYIRTWPYRNSAAVELSEHFQKSHEGSVLSRISSASEILFGSTSKSIIRDHDWCLVPVFLKFQGGASRYDRLIEGCIGYLAWMIQDRIDDERQGELIEELRQYILPEVPHLGFLFDTELISMERSLGILTYEAFRERGNLLLSVHQGGMERRTKTFQLGLLTLPTESFESGHSYHHSRRQLLEKLIAQFNRSSFERLLLCINERNEVCFFTEFSDIDECSRTFASFLEKLHEQSSIGTQFFESRIGISNFPNHGGTIDLLLRNARLAVSWSEKHQSSRVTVYDEKKMPLLISDSGDFWTDDPALNYRNTGLLLKSIEVIRHSDNFDAIEKDIVEKAIALTGAERGILLLCNKEGELQFKRGQTALGQQLETLPYISQSIPAQVLRTGDPVCFLTMNPDAVHQPGKSIQLLQLRSVMCTPLSIKGEVIGVLYVDSKKEKTEFVDVDLTFFHALGKQMGIVLEIARLLAHNKSQQSHIEKLNLQLQQKLDEQTYKMLDMEKEIASSRSKLSSSQRYDNIVGSSPKMKEMYSLIERTAPYDYPVLIEGESGTGKELVARAIHNNSSRKNNRFISENCGAIPDTLFEAELFGYKKGAFTGADRDKIGLIQQAHGGTLFLDEVANMSDAMQKGILRVIQEKEVRPVGSKTVYPVDVRIICSSNIPLIELVKEGTFRKDLFYRLNVITISLPPLRERKEDIPLLVEHFMAKTSKETGGPLKKAPADVLAQLTNYDWPGNVRELENEVRRLFVLSDQLISSSYVSPFILEQGGSTLQSSQPEKVSLSLKDQERELIIAALREAKGVKKEAAEKLGISRTNLYQKLKSYKIQSPGGY